jgi:hypothetical protein
MEYTIGSTVVAYVSGRSNRIIVDQKEADIKNGEPGFGGYILDGPDKGRSVWAYDSQIESVE